MNSPIRKLPGSKKQFPHVKPVVDTRKPAGVKPDKATAKPNPPANQTRPSWNSSTKIAPKPELYVKPLPGTKKQFEDLQRKSFQARPVPDSHYVEPFRPVLRSKKLGQFIGKTKLAEKSPAKPVSKSAIEPTNEEPIGSPEAEAQKETAGSGLISRIFHSVVDPILHATQPDQEAATEETESEDSNQAIQLPEGAVEVPAGTVDPGLMSRLFHSVVDPLLYPNTPEEEEQTGGIEKVAVKAPDSEGEATIKLHEDPLIMNNNPEPSAMLAESENAAVAGPSDVEPPVHKYPKGYGSKKERIRKAMEKKGIMPGDELPPKKPFKNQTRKRAKSPSLFEIYENLLKMPAYKDSE